MLITGRRKERDKTLVLLAILVVPGLVLADEVHLVAHFPLDEGRGALVRDIGPNALRAEVHGARWVQAGKVSLLAFDGEDDYVCCENSDVLAFCGPMTLTAWVWPGEVPVGEVGIAGQHFSSYLLTYYKDRKAWWYIGSSTNHTTAPVLPGTWSHIAATFDGERLRLYVNGELVDTVNSSFATFSTGGPFYIGCLLGRPGAEDLQEAQAGFFKGSIADVRLYAGILSAEAIRAQYAAEVQDRLAPLMAECRRIQTGVTIADGSLRVRIGRSGAIQIARGEGYCVVESGFSEPGKKIAWHWLAETPEAWGCDIKRLNPQAACVIAQGKFYTLERRVSIYPYRVQIEDTLTNLTDEPIGVLVKHCVLTPWFISKARLGTGSAEPLIFAPQPPYDLGIVVEDDIGRAQFAPFTAGNQAGFRTDHFALAPRSAYRFRWAIYVLEPTGDFWNFINQVRRDWHSNHTVLGPGSFFDVNGELGNDSARLSHYLKWRKLRVAMLSPWLDYDPGSMDRILTRDEYKVMMQRAAAAIKAADPEVKCLGCIETDWVTIYPERIEGGEHLPVDGMKGQHGPTVIGPPLAALIERSGLPWVDSMKRDAEGGALVELYSRGGKPQIALGVYPATGNYQAKFLMDQARFLCEEVGLDGFYIDEFSLFWVRSYDRWDGYTVDLDPRTGRIVRQYTDASIAGIDFRKQLCEYALSRGAVMVCNTFATTCTENALPVIRFAETWSTFDVRNLPLTGKPPYNAYIGAGQLGTPLGLGVLRPPDRVNSAELLMRGIVNYLRHGMLYYHYFYGDIPQTGEGSGEYGPINHMFPITPRRLFEGGVEGEERTITCVSGTYHWGHNEKPNVLVFGGDGRQLKGNESLRKVPGGWEVEVRLRDWLEIAVIEPAGLVS